MSAATPARGGNRRFVNTAAAITATGVIYGALLSPLMEGVSFSLVVAWLFVSSMVPETKGRTLEEIEADFRRTTVATSRAS